MPDYKYKVPFKTNNWIQQDQRQLTSQHSLPLSQLDHPAKLSLSQNKPIPKRLLPHTTRTSLSTAGPKNSFWDWSTKVYWDYPRYRKMNNIEFVKMNAGFVVCERSERPLWAKPKANATEKGKMEIDDESFINTDTDSNLSYQPPLCAKCKVNATEESKMEIEDESFSSTNMNAGPILPQKSSPCTKCEANATEKRKMEMYNRILKNTSGIPCPEPPPCAKYEATATTESKIKLEDESFSFININAGPILPQKPPPCAKCEANATAEVKYSELQDKIEAGFERLHSKKTDTNKDALIQELHTENTQLRREKKTMIAEFEREKETMIRRRKETMFAEFEYQKNTMITDFENEKEAWADQLEAQIMGLRSMNREKNHYKREAMILDVEVQRLNEFINKMQKSGRKT
ncbi:hypothetical protein P153DRAFT_412426 [Dothidotthia symphoricarpi CBS 119687]|uniref:Uncharacterized protein n=1 Tax=Dothidotthia symphoricarpi CBS 119687 TaxID=1392245 RepID=A0A6A5ZVH5_9PLEO|nr:uncharacterized protein P153DRAFT_412426 [Dothidotthia symphoricarpi CBS 119687]KAF2123732.1 hypothetical protein P153DRAFT_412426 [Dothidotthia symphoricarpi CBS 119687]